RLVDALQDSDITAILQESDTPMRCGYLGDVITQVSNHQPSVPSAPRLARISIVETVKRPRKKIYFD
ncbi:hypothetical protein, partial [Klebsiella pneumoniae]|uniref:hypothetical protein n=1 Tax=Klebsiella pneumoniae TaxID=573 RepID=UPI003B97F544